MTFWVHKDCTQGNMPPGLCGVRVMASSDVTQFKRCNGFDSFVSLRLLHSHPFNPFNRWQCFQRERHWTWCETMASVVECVLVSPCVLFATMMKAVVGMWSCSVICYCYHVQIESHSSSFACMVFGARSVERLVTV